MNSFKIKKSDMKSLGMWSMAGHKSCINCKLTDRPHNAGGLCKRCYYRTKSQHATQKVYREKIKLMAFKAYCGETPKCQCCGESELGFLSIDHINGCGVRRRKMEPSGSPIYAFLKARNYPSGYQVLCHNCNMSKAHLGVCPHESKKS